MNRKSKVNIFALVFAGVLFGSLIVSGAAFYFYKYHCRQIFYFESYDSSRICTETRYSEKKDGDEEIRAFVDDLLLGPMTNRFKFLFSLEQELNSAFQTEKSFTLDFQSRLFLLIQKRSI